MQTNNKYKYVSKCIPMYGAVGYLITRKGAKKIFKFLRNKDNIRETDTIIFNMIQLDLLRAYSSNYKIINTLGSIGNKDFLLGTSSFGSTIWKK